MTNPITKSTRWPFLLALLLAAVWVTGCQSSSAPNFAEWTGPASTSPAATGSNVANADTQPTAATSHTPSADLIRAGDHLTINITDLPQYVSEINDRVKDDGTITLLQNQTFVAAGKTLSELEKEIRERYVPRIFVSMTVSVKKQRESQFFYVGGEVRSPGRQVYISRLTVSKAIQSAGDFTEFANKRDVLLYRLNADKPIHINWKKLIDEPSLDLEVFPGDRIHIKRSLF